MSKYKNQHYVQKSIIKNFKQKGSTLYELEKENQEINPSKNPKNIFQESDFYSKRKKGTILSIQEELNLNTCKIKGLKIRPEFDISKSLEENIGSIYENEFSNILKELEKDLGYRELKLLLKTNKGLIEKYILFQFVRNKENKDFFNSSPTLDYYKIFFKDIKHIWKSSFYFDDNLDILKHIFGFTKKNICLYINDHFLDSPFILGDKGVFIDGKEEIHNVIIDKILLPISPKFMLGIQKKNEKIINLDDKKDIDNVNLCNLEQSEIVISSSETYLNKLNSKRK